MASHTLDAADRRILGQLQKDSKLTNVELSSRVTISSLGVSFDGPHGRWQADCDAILVAVGRRPNGAGLGAEAADLARTIHPLPRSPRRSA